MSLIVQNVRRNLFLSVLIMIAVINLYFKLGFHNKTFTPTYHSKILRSTRDLDDINLRDPTSFEALDDLRAQLTRMYPYDLKRPIPRHIWQSWKVSYDEVDGSDDIRQWIDDWRNEASFDKSSSSQDIEDHSADAGEVYNHRYTLLPDDQIPEFLSAHYGQVPIIVEAFNYLPSPILKADFLRYLILYARGGIYSDIDTSPVKSFENWPSLRHDMIQELKEKAKIVPYKGFKRTIARNDHFDEPGLVVGIEADPDRPDWADWYARRIQFCQWTIQSKPGHPALRELIMNITATTLYSVKEVPSNIKKVLNTSDHETDFNINCRGKKRNNKSINHKEKKHTGNVDHDDIMNWTGPGIFSDIIMEYMSHLIDKNKDVLLLNDNMAVNRQINFSKEHNVEREDDNDKSPKKFYSVIVTALESVCKLSWEFFSLITEPVLVDDIMVLPITSFSPNVDQMNAGTIQHPLALVLHYFAGSWKGEE